MSLLYAVIVRDNNITLADCETVSTNFPGITKKLFDKLQRNTRQTYVYQQIYHFHYINEDDFTYLCLSESLLPKVTAFAFLEEIKRLFIEKYSERERRGAINFGMQSTFFETLRVKMKYYNEDPESQKIKRLQKNLIDVTDQMTENIDKILDREDQVQALVIKTQTMNSVSCGLKATAENVRRDQEKRALRTKLFIGGVILAMILIIYLLY